MPVETRTPIADVLPGMWTESWRGDGTPDAVVQTVIWREGIPYIVWGRFSYRDQVWVTEWMAGSIVWGLSASRDDTASWADYDHCVELLDQYIEGRDTHRPWDEDYYYDDDEEPSGDPAPRFSAIDSTRIR